VSNGVKDKEFLVVLTAAAVKIFKKGSQQTGRNPLGFYEHVLRFISPPIFPRPVRVNTATPVYYPIPTTTIVSKRKNALVEN